MTAGSLGASGTCAKKAERRLRDNASAGPLSLPAIWVADIQNRYSMANRCSPLSRCITRGSVLLPDEMAWTIAILSHLKCIDRRCH